MAATRAPKCNGELNHTVSSEKSIKLQTSKNKLNFKAPIRSMTLK